MNLPHNHNEDATACQFLQEKIGDTENFQAVADVFKQLGFRPFTRAMQGITDTKQLR